MRDLITKSGGTWYPGHSAIYKNRSPNGSINIKVERVKITKPKALKAALQALPKVSQVDVYDNLLLVWFNEDPGIGPKINQGAYDQRLSTAAKSLKGLITSSGKTKDEILRDLSNLL